MEQEKMEELFESALNHKKEKKMNGRILPSDESEEDDFEDDVRGGEREDDIEVKGGVVPMQSYMRVVNKLQSVCRNLEQDGINIPTPRIAVVGGQSTGKSSLLEQIAGDIFLPRGAGTVTKCPVILQFIHSEQRKYKVDGTEYLDAKGVERAIRQKSEWAAKRDGGISNDPITVEINSPTCPNMTLVDLPGLIEIHAGDQSQDLPERINSMVLEQISNDQTIILAVASADSDFQNSKSIKLAQDVDSEGNRTIAVVTKMDKVDFTDEEERGKLRETLAGKNVSVKLGIIGVVNRTKKSTFDETKIKEAKLLKNNFPEISGLHGIEYLCNSLSRLQMHHIQDTLHSTMREIELNIKQQTGILEDLGIGEVVDKRDKLKKVAMKFAEDYKAEIEGSNRNVNIDSLCGSVKIKEILGSELAESLDQLDPLSEVTHKRILNAIHNHRGTEGFNYLSEIAFESVAPYQIKTLEGDCLNSLFKVYQVMKDEIPQSCFATHRGVDTDAQASQYPKLQNKLHQVICKLLEGPNEDVKEKIKDYIRTQAYTSTTYHPEFQSLLQNKKTKGLSLISPKDLSGLVHSKLSSKVDKVNISVGESTDSSSGVSEEESEDIHDYVDILNSDSSTGNLAGNHSTNMGPEIPAESSKKDDNSFNANVIKLVELMVETYFNIVKAQVQDQVPKIIKKHLIYHTSSHLSYTMTDFYNSAIASRCEGSLIREPEDVIQRRKGTLEKIKKLEDALIGFKEIKSMLDCGIENGS